MLKGGGKGGGKGPPNKKTKVQDCSQNCTCIELELIPCEIHSGDTTFSVMLTNGANILDVKLQIRAFKGFTVGSQNLFTEASDQPVRSEVPVNTIFGNWKVAPWKLYLILEVDRDGRSDLHTHTRFTTAILTFVCCSPCASGNFCARWFKVASDW
jgi:hypothetical protein